jgi:hypothetical protein
MTLESLAAIGLLVHTCDNMVADLISWQYNITLALLLTVLGGHL